MTGRKTRGFRAGLVEEGVKRMNLIKNLQVGLGAAAVMDTGIYRYYGYCDRSHTCINGGGRRGRAL